MAISKPVVLLLAALLIFTVPRSAVKVIAFLIVLNSSEVTFAPWAVTSLFNSCVPTVGVYFSACVKILNVTWFEFPWVSIPFVAASWAWTKRVSTSPLFHGVLPFNLETVPVIVTGLGASCSVLSARITSLFVTPEPSPKLKSLLFESEILTSNNFPELSVTLPIVISVLSVGVT